MTAAGQFDTDSARSFLFAAVELSGAAYPRDRYAAFTREINKRFPIPAVIPFRTAAGRLTLALVHRQSSRSHPDRNVMGCVSLIREISPANPHRAHLGLLSQLALPERQHWLDRHGRPRNFDGLAGRFGPRGTRHTPHHPAAVCLVQQRKGAGDDDLFIKNQAAGPLADYDRAASDSWYCAVLPNLFLTTFAPHRGTRLPRRGAAGAARLFPLLLVGQIADPARLQTPVFRRPPALA